VISVSEQTGSETAAGALLRVADMSVGYGPVPVVRSINIEVRPGEIVALLGPNGAGKTTTLLAIAGWLPVMSGDVWWLGERAVGTLATRARSGMGLVSAEQSVIRSITVRDNIRLGRGDLEYALSTFPELGSLLNRRAGLLSGGEQQILAIARALSRRPKLLLVDEMSLGLAPLVVRRVLSAIRKITDEEGLSILLVEQHLHNALEVADRAYVMRRGDIVMSGMARDMAGRTAEIEAHYLSNSAEL